MPRRRELDGTPGYDAFKKLLQRKWNTDDIGEGTYDYKGLYRESPAVAWNAAILGTHFPDTYKLPTHPTFSTESKYSNNTTPGGTWVEYPDGPWVFVHSPYTARHLDDTDDYLGMNVDAGGTPELSYWNGSYRLPTITVTPKRRRSLKYGGIHIKPENRGKFTETMRRTGKTAEELSHSSNSLTRKRAIFAINAKKWNHG